MVAWPPVGRSTVLRIRRQVVLPAPLGPSNPKISPGLTSKLTWSTADTLPRRRSLKLFVNRSTWIMNSELAILPVLPHSLAYVRQASFPIRIWQLGFRNSDRREGPTTAIKSEIRNPNSEILLQITKLPRSAEGLRGLSPLLARHGIIG